MRFSSAGGPCVPSLESSASTLRCADGVMPNLFSGGDLDRAILERSTGDWLARARAAADTRYVIATAAGRVLLREPSGAQGLALLTADHALVRDAPEEAHVL